MAPPAPPETLNEAEARRIATMRTLDLAALRPVIDRVTRLARSAADASHAYVTLVDDDRVWLSGFDDIPEHFAEMQNSSTARNLEAGSLWQEDLLRVWPDHPWVSGPPYARFYANAVIELPNGVKLGALCIAGTSPRPRCDRTMSVLADLAALLAEAIERLQATRAAEEAARETRAATAIKDALMKWSPVSLGVTDRDLRYLYVNEQWQKDKELTEEEALGRSMEELFPSTYELYHDTYARVLAGETIIGERVNTPLPDRPDRWLRATLSPWLDGEGKVSGLISMTHDITGVIGALESAKRSEKRLHMALEIADISVYELNYRTKTLRVEGAYDTFFNHGLTYQDLAPDIWVTVHPDDRDFAKAEWERHLSEGTRFSTEYRMNTPDREVWAFSSAELIYSEDGRMEGVLGVLKNITARKQSETAVMRARDAAEAANRAKSEFLANMSHEIRTPLNGVMGVASALSRTPLSDAQADMVELIETSAQTLEAILADVLDLARVESGRLELKTEAFDLGDCLRQAAALFRPAVEEKGLALGIDIAPEAQGAFVGDVVRIRQIVCNLMSNAVKFTATGRVGLRASACEGADGRSRLTLTVTDTGIGFSPEVKARLFERFQQADGSITRRYGGTGLGLAISRALAEAMGGTLDASSTSGEGAAFTLELALDRVADTARAQTAPRATPEEPSEREPRVLLAEDHAINRKVVELLLAQVGVDLTCVENGAEAVSAAAEGAFDLILMDMQMPVMDGLTAIRHIREDERSRRAPATPIWALSANALPEHVEASMAAGADGHLTKPISGAALVEVLMKACEQVEARERLAG